MDPRIVSAIQEILVGLIQILALVLATYAAKWVKAHVSQKQLDLAMNVAQVAVAATEQLAAAGKIEYKRKIEIAVQMARDQAKKWGLTFTDDQWQSLLESAVKAMKDAGEEIKKAPAA